MRSRSTDLTPNRHLSASLQRRRPLEEGELPAVVESLRIRLESLEEKGMRREQRAEKARKALDETGEKEVWLAEQLDQLEHDLETRLDSRMGRIFDARLGVRLVQMEQDIDSKVAGRLAGFDREADFRLAEQLAKLEPALDSRVDSKLVKLDRDLDTRLEALRADLCGRVPSGGPAEVNARFAVSLAQLDSDVDSRLNVLQAELSSLKLCAFDEELEGRFEEQRIRFETELSASLEHRLTKQYLDIGESLARQRTDFERKYAERVDGRERSLGERVDGRLIQLDGRLTEELSMQENRLKARLADLEATMEARLEGRRPSPGDAALEAVVSQIRDRVSDVEVSVMDSKAKHVQLESLHKKSETLLASQRSLTARLTDLEAAVDARLESSPPADNAAFEARLTDLEATAETTCEARLGSRADEAGLEARLNNLEIAVDARLHSNPLADNASFEARLESNLLLVLDRNMESRIGDACAKLEHDLQSALSAHAVKLDVELETRLEDRLETQSRNRTESRCSRADPPAGDEDAGDPEQAMARRLRAELDRSLTDFRAEIDDQLQFQQQQSVSGEDSSKALLHVADELATVHQQLLRSELRFVNMESRLVKMGGGLQILSDRCGGIPIRADGTYAAERAGDGVTMSAGSETAVWGSAAHDAPFGGR